MPSGRPIQIHRTKSPRRTLSLDTASQIIEKTNTSSHNQIQYDISPFKFSSQVYSIPLRISSNPLRNKLQSSPEQTPVLSRENSNPFRGNPLFPPSKIMTIRVLLSFHRSEISNTLQYNWIFTAVKFSTYCYGPRQGNLDVK